jgi:isopenicillin N synthase-like dioxygenase
MSKHFSSIPIIDVSPLMSGEVREQQNVAYQLGRAASEVGFLYVRGHGINEALFEGVLDAAKRFFAQPVERKMAVYIGRSKNHRGYVPEGEEVFASGSKDKKEAYDLSLDLPETDPDYLAGNPLLGPNQWPDIPAFRDAVGAYYNAVFQLGCSLIRGFSLALGEAPDFFDHYISKPPTQLRLIHYPFDAEAEDRMGIGAHTDYECFTLLRSTSPGLEVMNAAGDWIDAPPIPGAFLVNIGDMLEIFTNGRFVATSHRVRKVKEERYSFPLFFSVDYHTVIKPLDRFVTTGSPQGQQFVAGEHLFAQTAQTFTYLKERLARGEITLSRNAAGLSSFGQEARRHDSKG